MEWLKKRITFWREDEKAKLHPNQETKKAITINILGIFKKEKK